MKRHKHSVKIRKPNPAIELPRKPKEVKSASPLLPRWATIAICVFLAGGVTWAVCEFYVFAKLPSELVGKWVVQGGPQDGATFDFSRGGRLEAHFNGQGYDHPMTATVAVEDKTMFVTTLNPHTNQYETRACVMRELTANSLVVEFEKNEVFRMTRAR
jgi:hypothetical protein